MTSRFREPWQRLFEKGLSSAKVVWIPHAAHYVFRSHEAGVIREMNTFIAGLLLTNRGEMTGMSEHPWREIASGVQGCAKFSSSILMLIVLVMVPPAVIVRRR